MKKQFLPQLIKYGIAFQLLIFILFPLVSKAQCNVTFHTTANATTTVSANISILDSTPYPNIIYWEYGLSGFTPGTDSLPGIGGTIVNYTIGSQGINFTLSGLTPYTTYDIYTRKKCSPGNYSSNGSKQTFYTYSVCGSVNTLPCVQKITPAFSPGFGAWNINCGLGTGLEKLYSITPAYTGNFILTLYPSPISVSYYYSSTQACSPNNFYCIGINSSTDTIRDSLPSYAGNTSYILAKPNTITGGTGGSFKLDCACGPPSNINIYNITQYSASISYSGGGAGTIIELDTAGGPGSGSAAGPGGVVYNGGMYGMTITGLTPGKYYWVYTRNLCSGGILYSGNSIQTNFSTVACPIIYNYTTVNSPLAISSQWGQHLNPLVSYSTCTFDTLGYRENLIKFTPPVTGMYEINISSGYNDSYLGYRLTNNTCDFSNFNYICAPGYNNYYNPIGPLTAGATYDFLYQPTNSIQISNATFYIDCGSPTNVQVSNIQTNSATLSFNCNCPNPSYIEYGQVGTTTPTQIVSSSPVTLPNLLDNTVYYVNVKNYCGGSSFSNAITINFRTHTDCAIAPIITCDSVFTDGPRGDWNGNWTNYGCGTINNDGAERIYRFTPTQGGIYKLKNTFLSGYIVPISVYCKPATGTCDSTGWTCLGDLNYLDSINTNPLSANTTYLLLFDLPTIYYGNQSKYKIDCQVVCAAPSNPTSITGLIKPCPGATGIIYSISPVATATSYTWNVPAGATIVSGAGTNSITVNYDSTFVSGDITVTANNACGSSAARIKSVSRNVPNTPPGIIGTEYGLCGGKTTTYSINVSSLTNTYLWSVPSGVTINSGQGTKNISVTFPVNFSPATISVKAGNSCGYGNAQTLVVNATPKPPTIINGPNTVCVNQTGVIYTISSSSNKTTYNWGVPTGATITSGQGTSAIKMNFGTVAGDITVNTANACGAGSNRILSVAIVCREGASTMNDALDVNIYPNPSNNYFTVDAHFATEGNYNLTVRDILGRVVEIYSNINYQQSFNFGKTLHTGIYFVEVSKGNERQVLRVVKSDN